MDILSHGVGFNADNAASLTEAAFTRQHAHLWPEVEESERLARLAMVRHLALLQLQPDEDPVVELGDVHLLRYESEDTTEPIGAGELGAGDDHGSHEAAGGNTDAEPGAAVPRWTGLDGE